MTSTLFNLTVGPHKTPTSNPNGGRDDLLAKRDTDAEFGNWSDIIEQFNHVEGHQYVIEVQETPVPQGLQIEGRPTVYWRLTKIISDEKVE